MSSHEQLTRALLRNHDVATVVELLNNALSGVKVSYNQVMHVRTKMVGEGALAPARQNGPALLPPDDPGIPAYEKTEQNYAARMGCERLHEATRALYRRTASRLGCSEEVATLVLNYSPAQLAKRVAA